MIFKSSDFIKMNKQIGESGELINKEMLESVLSSFFYYDDLVEQVASIYRGLAKNHAFKDGNKRTATLFLIIMLKDYKKINENELQDLVLDVAEHKYDVETISNKIKKLKNFTGVSTIDLDDK